MSDEVDFRVLELLCGRLCHELVSPIGAINNGVELLGEDDPEFVKEAMGLIGQSARKAGQRLQFYRFAYGTAGAGASVGAASAPNGRDLSAGLLEGGKVRSEWEPEASALAPPWQRIACNLLVLGAEALPRGGTVRVRAARGGVEVVAEGDVVSLQPEVAAALGGGADEAGLGARTIQAFYAFRLARHLGARVHIDTSSKRVALAATPAGPAAG